ncbi:MAG TPA: ComEC/Rec2 family competence protein [Kiritimatiellia bacterium]|nr:ComEC/Rec2 family competence protein [Kiritimatiellia bacterium]
MNKQSAIIAFCYFYIAGIVVAMMAPVDPSRLAVFNGLTAALLVPALFILLWDAIASDRPGAVSKRRLLPWLTFTLLTIGALLLGYSRYIAADTVPDMRIGEIRIDGDERVFAQNRSLPDASRLRIEKKSPLERDVRIRLVGELDARVPVRDTNGIAELDEEGRWRFRMSRISLSSDIITIRADDPEGTGYVIDQPFSRISGIEWVDGPEAGLLEVHRISNHIGSFVRPGRAQSPVTVLARITSDPRVYDFKTVIMVTPAYIQYPAGGPFYRVEGGDIQVTIQTNMIGYSTFARTEAYGADVELRGELTVARSESNPGGFNARQFMQNYNIYGLMNLFQAPDRAPPMQMVAAGGIEPREGNPLVRFSLSLRDDILSLFKATMPHPQSAFLGGVTLGLRYGLQGVQFPGEQERGKVSTWFGVGRSEAQIVDDFRASGVNHVLAVSGLHVTIITAMFIAIFGLLRFPKTMFVPFIIFALVVFAIITGARPSTLRAVIMNSLFLMTWAYLDKSLLSSVMIGVPVAAFVILLHNPLVVVDPSFTLSFGAILSLALITMPVHDLMSKLRGNVFLAVILLSAVTTVIAIQHWALVVSGWFIVPWLILCLAVCRLAGEISKKGIGVSDRFAFSAMPESVSTFLAAQVAIQVGMMIPLSAYYFCRWPFGGAYANLIAIPLIGIVVQLGAIAGLLGLIPFVGPYIALVLNAANWLFTTFFLWLAHVCTLIFPYPFVRRPRLIEVVVYYVFVAAFIWHRPIWRWIKRVCEARGLRHRAAPGGVAVMLAIAATIPLWLAPPRDNRSHGLHVSVLSVGYGSSILVESPGGRKILIDSGFVEHERGRRNEADRTILPFLSHAGIRSLDALILTSPLPERSAGASYLLDQLRVSHLLVPPMMKSLHTGLSFDDFKNGLRIGSQRYDSARIASMYHELIGNPEWPLRPSLAKSLASRHRSALNRWADWYVAVNPVMAGQALFEENIDGIPFRIEVLGPDKQTPREHPIENLGLVLRIVYGDFAMLLPGSLHYEGQRYLADYVREDVLASSIMIVPHHAAAIPGRTDRPSRADVWRALEQSAGSLLEKVDPELAIVEFGSPRPVLGDPGRAATGVHDITRQFYADRLGEDAVLGTDRDLAIMIYSDGKSYTIDTMARRHRARGGELDAVSDLSIGF